ncbi:glutathione reductase [Stenotrophomonas pictorum JCM 9942]|uniref:Glutathione reductase n=1 Tax=Stenotrophomonas pictorum JCM 9942 TaxID=1236960 RepID=A0A0R0AK14_9GAMM|nr:glutathione-disulfide reductase [Stenotrophomonas pictorum]KRG45455.1 glutathione reductase [Stenotrophomonas pictorum JCM 9942]
MSARDFDVVVIGGGSGGLAAAFRAASYGARVAMLEPGDLGGTCVNVGCVPKKAMWLAAELAERITLASRLGFDVPQRPRVDWPELVRQRQQYIANIHVSYQRRLDETGVTRVHQRGRVIDAHTVECADGTRLRTQHIVIATGAQPVRPRFPGAELGGVSDDFFALRRCPSRVGIVGGGYIAVELAGVLRALGAEVVMLVRGQRLLERFDAELADQLIENLRLQGVELHFGCQIQRLEQDGGQIRATLDNGTEQAVFEQVIFATGRAPNTRDLGLEQAGVVLGEKGQVVVDAFQTSAVPSIHAVGDVAGHVTLTPVAVAAARRLMDRLFGGQPQARLDYDNVPSVVFSHPPLGSVGLSEEEARKRFDRVSTYHSRFRPMLQALGEGELRTVFKMVCAGEEEKVVGIHLLGESADEILQGFAVALKAGITRAQMNDTVAIHPTSAEEVVLMR